MKVLKVLLVTVLALGISTSFTNTAYAEAQNIQSISYDELSKEAQAEFEVLVNEYCTALDEHKENTQGLSSLQNGSGFIALTSLGAIATPKVWYVTLVAAMNFSPNQRNSSVPVTKLTKALTHPSVTRVIQGIGSNRYMIYKTALGSLALWGSTKAYNVFSPAQKKLKDKEKMTAKELKSGLDEYDVESVSYKKIKESLESFCESN